MGWDAEKERGSATDRSVSSPMMMKEGGWVSFVSLASPCLVILIQAKVLIKLNK